MNKSLSMSATKISAFLNEIEIHGVHKSEIIKAADINPHIFISPDNRLVSVEVKRIFEVAARLTNNEDIGLLQGAKLSKGFASILGYVMMNCSTLGEAAEKYCRYEKLVDGTGITEIQTENNQILLTNRTTDNHLINSRQLSDFKMSGILSYMELLTATKVTPKMVYFTHKCPNDISLYTEIFKCPIIFDKPFNAVLLDRHIMKQPITEPNKELKLLFEKIALNDILKIDMIGSYSQKVIAVILNDMTAEVPTIESVASKLSMSVRNLQFCLKREDNSFKIILNNIRMDMALHYMKEREISISDIAFILGFSEVSSFHRAFKRWTSVSPSEYRSQNQN